MNKKLFIIMIGMLLLPVSVMAYARTENLWYQFENSGTDSAGSNSCTVSGSGNGFSNTIYKVGSYAYKDEGGSLTANTCGKTSSSTWTGNQDSSMSLWARTNDTYGINFAHMGNMGANYQVWNFAAFDVSPGSRAIGIDIQNSGCNVYNDTIRVSDANWHHYAYRYFSATKRFEAYYDGQFVGNCTIAITPAKAETNIYVNNNQNLNVAYGNRYVDDLRMYWGSGNVLTKSQITWLYNNSAGQTGSVSSSGIREYLINDSFEGPATNSTSAPYCGESNASVIYGSGEWISPQNVAGLSQSFSYKRTGNYSCKSQPSAPGGANYIRLDNWAEGSKGNITVAVWAYIDTNDTAGNYFSGLGLSSASDAAVGTSGAQNAYGHSKFINYTDWNKYPTTHNGTGIVLNTWVRYMIYFDGTGRSITYANGIMVSNISCGASCNTAGKIWVGTQGGNSGVPTWYDDLQAWYGPPEDEPLPANFSTSISYDANSAANNSNVTRYLNTSVTVTNPGGNYSLTTEVLRCIPYSVYDNGLLYYYTMDNTVTNSTSTRDSITGIASKYVGTITTGVNGKLGQAVRNDGSGGDRIDTQTPMDSSSDISFSAWVNYSSLDQNGIIGDWDDGGTTRLFFYYNNNQNKYYLNFYDVTNNFHQAELSATPTIGQWYHVAFTINSTTAVIYNNGGAGTPISSGGGLRQSSAVNVTLLDRIASSLPLNGTLDEVGIWNRALTDPEVKDLYNNGSGLQFTGTNCSLYTNTTFNTTTQSITWDLQNQIQFNTRTLYYRSYYNGSNIYLPYRTFYLLGSVVGAYYGPGSAANNSNITRYLSTSVYANNSASIVNYTLTTEIAQINTTTLTNNLNAYYSFDTANPLDSISSTNFTVNSGSWNSSAKLGGGFTFDGTGNALTYSSASHFPKGNTSWAYSLWVNIGTLPSSGQFKGLFNWGSQNPYVGTYTGIGNNYGNCAGSGDTLVIGMWGMGGNPCVQYTHVADTWKHYVYMYNAATGNYSAYINGAYVGSGIDTTPINLPSTNQEAAIAMGIDTGNTFIGTVDELGVWNRTLTQSEISQLYNSGSGFNPTQVGNTYTTIYSNTTGLINANSNVNYTIVCPSNNIPNLGTQDVGDTGGSTFYSRGQTAFSRPVGYDYLVGLSFPVYNVVGTPGNLTVYFANSSANIPDLSQIYSNISILPVTDGVTMNNATLNCNYPEIPSGQQLQMIYTVPSQTAGARYQFQVKNTGGESVTTYSLNSAMWTPAGWSADAGNDDHFINACFIYANGPGPSCSSNQDITWDFNSLVQFTDRTFYYRSWINGTNTVGSYNESYLPYRTFTLQGGRVEAYYGNGSAPNGSVINRYLNTSVLSNNSDSIVNYTLTTEIAALNTTGYGPYNKWALDGNGVESVVGINNASEVGGGTAVVWNTSDYKVGSSSAQFAAGQNYLRKSSPTLTPSDTIAIGLWGKIDIPLSSGGQIFQIAGWGCSVNIGEELNLYWDGTSGSAIRYNLRGVDILLQYSFTNDTWYQLTFTQTQISPSLGNVTMWVNGVYADSETYNFDSNLSNSKIVIGRTCDENGGQVAKHWIDDLRFYETPLDGQTLATFLYNGGAGTSADFTYSYNTLYSNSTGVISSIVTPTELAWYKPSNGFSDSAGIYDLDTIVGTVAVNNTFGKVSGSSYQSRNSGGSDAAKSSITSGIPTGQNLNLSFCSWIYPQINFAPVAVGFQRMHNSGSFYRTSWAISNTAEGIKFQINGDGAPVSGYVPTQNVWTHYCIVYDGQTRNSSVYINGNFHSSGIMTNVPDFEIPAIEIFNYNDGNGGWQGYMDDVRFYTQKITEADVSFIYNGGSGTLQSINAQNKQDITWDLATKTQLSNRTYYYRGWINGTLPTGSYNESYLPYRSFFYNRTAPSVTYISMASTGGFLGNVTYQNEIIQSIIAGVLSTDSSMTNMNASLQYPNGTYIIYESAMTNFTTTDYELTTNNLLDAVGNYTITIKGHNTIYGDDFSKNLTLQVLPSYTGLYYTSNSAANGTRTTRYLTTEVAANNSVSVLNYTITTEIYNNVSSLVSSYTTSGSGNTTTLCTQNSIVQGLVGYYGFNTGNQTLDNSPNGNNATLTGTGTVTGKVGGGLSVYDGKYGAQNRITIPYIPQNGFDSSESVSFCLWANATTLSGSDFMANQFNTNSNGDFILQLGDDNAAPRHPRFAVSKAYVNSNFADSTSAFITGSWQYYCAVYDGGTNAMKLYVNGVNVANSTFAYGPANNPGLPWTISTRDSGDGTWMFDEASIWNRTLSDSDVSYLYNSGSGLTYSNFTDCTQNAVQTKIWDFDNSPSLADGFYTYRSWINDTSSTRVANETYLPFRSFDMNQNPPVVTIDNPLNNTIIQSRTIEIRINSTDRQTISRVWYNVGNSTNYTYTGYINYTFPTDGQWTLTAYANDTDNLVGNASVTFTINTPNPRWTNNGRVGGAYEFDSLNDYIIAYNITNHTTTTLWYKLGQWYYIVNRSGVQYVNMVVNDTFQAPYYYNGSDLVIGRDASGTYYGGTIDEVQTYPTAVSDAQLLLNYNNGLNSTPNTILSASEIRPLNTYSARLTAAGVNTTNQILNDNLYSAQVNSMHVSFYPLPYAYVVVDVRSKVVNEPLAYNITFVGPAVNATPYNMTQHWEPTLYDICPPANESDCYKQGVFVAPLQNYEQIIITSPGYLNNCTYYNQTIDTEMAYSLGTCKLYDAIINITARDWYNHQPITGIGAQVYLNMSTYSGPHWTYQPDYNEFENTTGTNLQYGVKQNASYRITIVQGNYYNVTVQ